MNLMTEILLIMELFFLRSDVPPTEKTDTSSTKAQAFERPSFLLLIPVIHKYRMEKSQGLFSSTTQLSKR
jgi:hypothetical protein